jgi:hypothetical protein
MICLSDGSIRYMNIDNAKIKETNRYDCIWLLI